MSPADGGITRAELAGLQRSLFAARTSVNESAAAQAEAMGEVGSGLGDEVAACVQAVVRLDAVVDSIHRQLRRGSNRRETGTQQR